MPRKSTVSCWPFWGRENQSAQKLNQHFPRSNPEGRRCEITEPSLCEITLVPSRDSPQPSGCAPQANDRKRAGERRTATMIAGMSTFTSVHVVLSLIGIFSGFVVWFGLLAAKRLD